MLLPYADDNQGRLRTPFVVYALIALNAVVFLFLQQAGRTPSGVRFTYGYAAVPYEITNGVDLTEPVALRSTAGRLATRPGDVIPEAPGPSPIWLTLLTSMFLHGGWMHIIGNMLYLWIFGDNIEDRLGHGKFIIFYLISGLVASAAHIMIDPSSPIPSLGASGAIAGVLGAYLVWFPHNRVRALATLGYFLTTVELPAVIVLGFWIVIQIISQYTSSFGHAGGVAYMAHIGGFFTGLVIAFLFGRVHRTTRSSW